MGLSCQKKYLFEAKFELQTETIEIFFEAFGGS